MDNAVLISGVLVSICILGVLIYLQKNSPNILKVPAQWIAIAALPIIIVLFAGGYIDKFSGFGIVLEKTLNSPIINNTENNPALASVVLSEQSILSDAPSVTKASSSQLEKLTVEQKLDTRYIRFVEGKNSYVSNIVEKYFTALPNLYFVEIIDQNNAFVALIPMQNFVSSGFASTYNSEEIDRFVESLGAKNVLSTFASSVITKTLSSDTDLITVLKTMKIENIKYLGVVSATGNYIGVAIQRDIEKMIADSVLLQN